MSTLTPIRIASGLRGTTHLLTWIGNEAGVFARHGLEVSFPTLACGGPESVRGLVAGDWDFVHTGTVPIAENVLNGGDAVIIARNTDQHMSIYVMTQPEITDLSQLEGKKVGVLTDAWSGQTGVVTRKAVEAGGATAEYVGLGSYANIFAALAEGQVAAGALQIDGRYIGQKRFGWNAFPTSSLGMTSVFATTRRKIAEDPDVVARTFAALLDCISLFKNRPDEAVPLLDRALEIGDLGVSANIHRNYVQVFPDQPWPDMDSAIASLQDLFRSRYPHVDQLRTKDIADPGVIESLTKQ
jgi:ABC-type nitrate/sulfonate/bicarbonate transport system substrate-binding protein